MKRGIGISAAVLLLAGTLGVSTAYGILLLLPLYVQELGGDEASFGLILSAGAIPAVLCIGTLIRYPEALRPHAIVAIAVAVYAAGAGGVSLTTESWIPLVGLGVLLGTAWAMVYTATPMIMSEMVTDEKRASFFGYLTGTQQIGIGAGPVIARFLVGTSLGFRGTFLVAGVLCLGAVVLTLVVGMLTPDVREVSGDGSHAQSSQGTARSVSPFGHSIRRILGSEAAFSLVLIVLFACLFTSMTSFQTTFAKMQELDYSVYYVAYTVAVIFSRFMLAGMASRFDSRLVIAAAISVMATAVASFLLVGSNALIYGVASTFLGLGYGLALPSVQAQAVNVSEAAVRPRVLPVAGLLFQAAILGFPLVAGWLIASFGYTALFAVLVSLALVQVSIAWWRFAAAKKTARASNAPLA